MDTAVAVQGGAGAPAGLRRERVGSWKTYGAMRAGLLFATCAAVLALLLSSGSTGWAVAVFIGVLLLYFGTGLFLIVHKVRTDGMVAEAAEQARRVLPAFAGGPLEPLDTSGTFRGKECLGSGIGWDGRTLFVLDHGEAFEVPLHLVREWSWKIPGKNIVSTYGRVDISVQTDVNMANAEESARAYQSSGLFLKLADIDKPVLHFTCSNQRTLERWHEFLRQACDARAAEEAEAERERAEAHAERDRLAALPSVQGIRLGMSLAEAEETARTAYDRAEDAGSGRRYLRAGGETLAVEAGDDGRVASVTSSQSVEAGLPAVRASLERKYGPPAAVRGGRLEFAAASDDGRPASLVADMEDEGGRIRLVVTLAPVPEAVPGLRL